MRLLRVCFVSTPNIFRMAEPIFIKLGMSIEEHESINSSDQ
jgi:hypothetical protein